MESGFSIGPKKSKVASRSSTETNKILSNVLPETAVTSVWSDEDCHKKTILEEEGYNTLKLLVDEENVTLITAINLKTGGIVTIKIMSKAGDSGFCRKKGFHQEIEMMRHLKHPNLIMYYQSIETPRRYYIVMEYASNGSLFDLLQKEKCLTESKARQIYRQLFSVLSYCNARGAIHHDIRSATILFDSNNLLKISIFGYSYRSMIHHSVVVDVDCESSNLSEPDYADIYRSGIVLFEMVYGKTPKGYTNVSLKHSLRCLDSPDQPDISTTCKDLISRIVLPGENRISWNEIATIDWMMEEEPIQIEE